MKQIPNHFIRINDPLNWFYGFVDIMKKITLRFNPTDDGNQLFSPSLTKNDEWL